MGAKQSQPAQETITLPQQIPQIIQLPPQMPLQMPPQPEVVQQQYSSIMSQLKMIEDMIEKEQEQCKQLPSGSAVKTEGQHEFMKKHHPMQFSPQEELVLHNGAIQASNGPRISMEQVSPSMVPEPRQNRAGLSQDYNPKMEYIPARMSQMEQEHQSGDIMSRIDREIPSAPSTRITPEMHDMLTARAIQASRGRPGRVMPESHEVSTIHSGSSSQNAPANWGTMSETTNHTNLPLDNIEHFDVGGTFSWLLSLIILIAIIIFIIKRLQ